MLEWNKERAVLERRLTCVAGPGVAVTLCSNSDEQATLMIVLVRASQSGLAQKVKSEAETSSKNAQTISCEKNHSKDHLPLATWKNGGERGCYIRVAVHSSRVRLQDLEGRQSGDGAGPWRLEVSKMPPR